jgi:hypothetical protein
MFSKQTKNIKVTQLFRCVYIERVYIEQNFKINQDGA